MREREREKARDALRFDSRSHQKDQSKLLERKETQTKSSDESNQTM
jgi:hypothetical protein